MAVLLSSDISSVCVVAIKIKLDCFIPLADYRGSGSFTRGTIRFALEPEDSRNEDFIVFGIQTRKNTSALSKPDTQTLLRFKSTSDFLEVLLVSRRRRIFLKHQQSSLV